MLFFHGNGSEGRVKSRRPCRYRFAPKGTKPCRPVTPFGSWRADSSHSRIHVDALLPQLSLLLLAHPFSLRGYSPFSWVRSTVAPSNSIQSSIFKAKVSVTSSPASRSSKAVAESSSMLTPLSSCMFGRVSWVSEPVGFLNDKSNFFDQSISGFRARNHRSRRTRLYALIGTTSSSDSSTGARCFKYWTEKVIFRLSFVCSITWPLRPRVVVWAAWCRSPSLRRSLGDIKMLGAPQSIRARTRCISPCRSRIWTSWIMCTESGVSVPQRYWLNMWAPRLSKTTLGLNDIRCGWTSSKVSVNARVATACIPSAISSYLSRRARYRER